MVVLFWQNFRHDVIFMWPAFSLPTRTLIGMISLLFVYRKLIPLFPRSFVGFYSNIVFDISLDRGGCNVFDSSWKGSTVLLALSGTVK